MDIMARLKQAVEAGELLEITYSGGTNPGAAREIAPISVSDTTRKLRARCYTSGAVKTFMIDRITIKKFNQQDGTPTWAAPKSYATLSELYETNYLSLTSLGWHVKLEADALNLFKAKKNGDLLKHPTLSISYHETTVREELTPEGTIESFIVPRKLKWSVQGRAYKTLTSAATSFMAEAKKISTK